MRKPIIQPRLVTPRAVAPRIVSPKAVFAEAGKKPKPIPVPDALNFYMPDGGTITLTRNGTPTVVELEYSIDNGATWQVWEEVGNVRSLTLAAGQKMYVRNTSETSTGFNRWTDNYNYIFSFDDTAEAYGNIMSLLCVDPQQAVLANYCFLGLFKNATNLVKADILLPSTAAAENCYRQMFYGCTNLAIGPSDIMLSALINQCCSEMFYGCTGLLKSPVIHAASAENYACHNMFILSYNLNHVETHMTSITTNATLNWLYETSPTGDLYCPAELTLATGESGIPSGWTRHDI